MFQFTRVGTISSLCAAVEGHRQQFQALIQHGLRGKEFYSQRRFLHSPPVPLYMENMVSRAHCSTPEAAAPFPLRLCSAWIEKALPFPAAFLKYSSCRHRFQGPRQPHPWKPRGCVFPAACPPGRQVATGSRQILANTPQAGVGHPAHTSLDPSGSFLVPHSSSRPAEAQAEPLWREPPRFCELVPLPDLIPLSLWSPFG